MTGISESYKKVRYDLRPAKQVERLMLLDAFRRLTAAGFRIDRYQYTGMGSIHFYDYSLFHRYAGISRMVSAEISKKIKRRVKFNRPFSSVEVVMEPIGTVINSLDAETQHLLWMDYDSTMKQSYLADTTQAAAILPAGSILLITVDVEPPRKLTVPSEIRTEYESEFGDLLPQDLKPASFTPKNLSRLNTALLFRAIDRGLAGRVDVGFQPLFNFLYRDGHKMLTIGGMITDTPSRKRLLDSDIRSAAYVRPRRNSSHYIITVPVLTRRERIVMDANMPVRPRWKPREFELPRADVVAYSNIYQYAPNFAELIF